MWKPSCTGIAFFIITFFPLSFEISSASVGWISVINKNSSVAALTSSPFSSFFSLSSSKFLRFTSFKISSAFAKSFTNIV